MIYLIIEMLKQIKILWLFSLDFGSFFIEVNCSRLGIEITLHCILAPNSSLVPASSPRDSSWFTLDWVQSKRPSKLTWISLNHFHRLQLLLYVNKKEETSNLTRKGTTGWVSLRTYSKRTKYTLWNVCFHQTPTEYETNSCHANLKVIAIFIETKQCFAYWRKTKVSLKRHLKLFFK